MQSLLLYPAERKVFDGLPADLRDGWTVEEEMLTSKERPEELKMRALMFHDKSLQPILEQAKNVKTAEEIEEVMLALQKLPPLVQFKALFTLGIEGLSSILHWLLEHARSDQELQGMMELSRVRHLLLETNAEVTSSTS